MAWAAVILTGGTAARLDGADKSSLEYDGRSLLEHALEAVAGSAETVVVGPEVPTSRPVTFTRESPPGGGPLAGLAAGIAALRGATPLVLVLAVDMPHVTAATVRRLVASVGGSVGAWLVDERGRRQLAGVVQRSVVPAGSDVSGLPMRLLMDLEGTVDVPAIGPEADDIDTWADVTRLGGGAT